MALTILLADDSMTAQNMGKKILTDAGYEVITVSNGAAAVKKIAEAQLDLAILDVYMPGYTGLEVCERLKSTPATARVPVLLSVGKMEPFRPEDGMKAKADGVIVKPFEATDLVTVVSKLSERAYGAPAAAVIPPPVAVPSPMPDQDTSDEMAPSSPDPVADSASAEHDVSLSNHEEPALQHFTSMAHDEPVAEAPGLQTFESEAIPSSEIPVEEHLTSSAASDLSHVAAAIPAGFEPTSAQTPDALDDVPDTTLMGSVGGSQEETVHSFHADFHQEAPMEHATPLQAEAFASEDPMEAFPNGLGELVADTLPAEGLDVLEPAVAESASRSEWKADEAVLDEQDLSLDLEAEMRAAQVEPSEVPQQASQSPSVAPFAAAAAAGLGALPQSHAPEAAKPLLAPLGKTSFDEMDAIMAESAARFDTANPALGAPMDAAIEEPVAETADAILLESEVADVPELETVSADFLEETAIDLEPTAAAPAAFDPVFEPDLLSEDTEETTKRVAAPSLRISDSLSGVFDMDSLNQPAVVSTPSDQAPEDLVSALDPAYGVTVTEDGTAEAETLLEPNEELPVHVEESATEMPVHETQDAAEGDAGSETRRYTSDAEMKDFGEAVGTAPAAAPDVSEDELSSIVERVVERVVDRLKPMLVVMIEEILREMKKI